MRTLWNEGWLFTKDVLQPKAHTMTTAPVSWEAVDLPHTWNGTDGQDGGNDYYRGTCYYAKRLAKDEISAGAKAYIEFAGTNSSASLYLNGEKIAHHDGGYSTWRAELTPYLQEQNEILVAVDNAPNDSVYPQVADFTFYGGIYRNVTLITVGEAHFDLDDLGGPAVIVTPEVQGESASVKTQVYVSGTHGSETLVYTIMDKEREIVSRTVDVSETTVELSIEHVHLWNGRKDPHLYTMQVKLNDGETTLDTREVRFGCRSFAIDPEKGFLLNGKSYPLRGVSRHQDRPRIGNALKKEHHEQDIDLIMEMGATTVRLAHYQHDQYFYDLCDERGLVVWAEIPYISRNMPKGRANTITQMKELIVQNYNHPCIVVWGLSNEITMRGAQDADLLENHHLLNDLCHEMDKTRLTAIAVVSMCGIDEAYVRIPDVVSYNLYYGWYGGDTSMNGTFMDNFHERYPKQPIGMSEYGCEALNWHSSNPQQGDYTEEYQAYYHEELIRQLYTRPYIWATHVWNMFDFAADARSEGGEDGMNHKGLVTFDRKYKKDAFYAYKAWLSDEPFVHICGKRYVDRVEDTTKVSVYSNQPEVELFVNGKSLGVKESAEHFFYFDVPNAGESTLVAKAGDCRDESRLRKVAVFNEDYRMKETGDVINWFEITAPEGYFSLNDRLGDIMENPSGQQLMSSVFAELAKSRQGKEGEENAMDPCADAGMMQMLSGFTVKRMITMAAGTAFTKDQMLEINRELNKIKKQSS